VATIAGTREQRGAERHERDVRPLKLGGGRLGRLPREQLQRDQQQEQAAGAFESGQPHPQVFQDRPAEKREYHDHPEGHDRGLPGQPFSVLVGPAPGQPQENRDRSGRIDDDEQRDKYIQEELQQGHVPAFPVSGAAEELSARNARLLPVVPQLGPCGGS